jgi:hypothetical protein
VAEDSAAPEAVVVVSEAEWSAAGRVWGTGGWLPPEGREGLDWLTLSRFLGWGVRTIPQTDPGLTAGLSGVSGWAILACDPDSLGEEFALRLGARLGAEPLLVVIRAGKSGGALARLAGAARTSQQIGGRFLRWSGPGPERHWYCRKALDGSALKLARETSAWVTLDGVPIVSARRVGRSVVATLGFHPSQARDTDGAATALLKHLLTWGSAVPVAWLDLDGSLILRMDDPGSAENVYHHAYCGRKLGEADWAMIGADLRRRNGRLSIGYVGGWADDGDARRGVLKVAGHAPDRIPGWVHPSPLVQYLDLAGHTPGTLYDYEAEFRGIQALRAAGLGDVELHGHTHMHPDSAAWAKAPDRYEAVRWYRELGKAAQAALTSRPPEKHPLRLGIAALRQYFGTYPTTLICPGDEWSNDVLERALDLGLQLVSSYYLALRDPGRFCWAQHVCAPYLDQPSTAWFDSGLPVVGYFHDFDLTRNGVGWMSRWLDQWQNAGAKKLMDLRELAAVVGHRLAVTEQCGTLCLTVTGADALARVRPLGVVLRIPGGQVPSRVAVALEGRRVSLEVHPLGNGLGRAILPCSSPISPAPVCREGGNWITQS